MDAINFLQELQKVLIDGAQQLQNTASTTGVGTTEPKGVITAIVGTASVVNSAGGRVRQGGCVQRARTSRSATRLTKVVGRRRIWPLHRDNGGMINRCELCGIGLLR